MSGARNYHAGLSAEDAVQRQYEASGATCLERRWRGRSGEIDLIFERSGLIVFVEVKTSSSFARATQRLSARQLRRLQTTAEEYLTMLPDGLNTACQFDLGVVNGVGQVEIIPNILI
ncbi:YraN family protein [Qingshengfaniella alkalisoli]|uniref:UPF0102 protein FPZ52_08565 n=1 Tax=Qingshengfaniella alkalisoli TaxID=2599296 RepID=A0A5B8I7S6_9RHOB|nr:YraN family protein [Qingshengfaniella alkalisoli]QDY69669.1 hypothetical protein FPZ52_08565 [Qingshengfaniella alkalisoli]